MLFLSCNFSYLVSCQLGWRHGYLKVVRGFFLSRRRLLQGFVLFLCFSGSIFARRGARSKGGFSWVRFFLVGVGWIGLGVLGMKKFARIPVLDPLVFSFFVQKSGVSFHSSGSGICHVYSHSLRRATPIWQSPTPH